MTAELQDAKVSSLINPITRQWKSTVLSFAFNQVESELIQQIQLTKTKHQQRMFCFGPMFSQVITRQNLGISF